MRDAGTQNEPATARRTLKEITPSGIPLVVRCSDFMYHFFGRVGQRHRIVDALLVTSCSVEYLLEPLAISVD